MALSGYKHYKYVPIQSHLIFFPCIPHLPLVVDQAGYFFKPVYNETSTLITDTLYL